MNIAVYDMAGKPVKEIAVSKDVFGVALNADLVHQVARILQSRTRKVIAHAKDRAQVSGGGKKPWKQKGTGRARHGSIRSPLWRGGGVTHGPMSNKNFVLDVNKKMKEKALRMVLSARVEEKRLVVVDAEPSFADNKTKHASVFFKTLLKGLDIKGRALFVHTFGNAQQGRAIRNLAAVQWMPARSIGMLDVMSYPTLVCTEASLRELESVAGAKTKKSKSA